MLELTNTKAKSRIMSLADNPDLTGLRSVTVVIAAKDAEATISRAVMTALRQPEALQVIVVDDGSSDDTAGAAKSADDGSGRLEIIRLDKNQGPSAARNTALDVAKCEWYTMLDSDDFLDDGRLGRLLDIAGNTYDFVADDLYLVQQYDENGPRECMWAAPAEDARCDLNIEFFLEANVSKKDRRRRELGFIKPIIRRSRIEELGLRYDERMRLGEDLIFYCELFLANCPSLLVEPNGYVAVRRANSLSGRHGTDELRNFYNGVVALQTRTGLLPSQQKILSRFRNVTSRRYRWSRLIDAKKSKNPLEIAPIFVTSPDVMAYLAMKVLKRGLEKFSGSKEPATTG